MSAASTSARSARSLVAIATVCATALLVGACGGSPSEGDDGGDGTTTPSGDPSDLGLASKKPATGTERFECRLVDRDGGAVRLAVDLPRGFEERKQRATQCWWEMEVPVPRERYTTTVDVLLQTVGPEADLEDEYDRQEPYAVADDDFGGDETIWDLELDEGVPIFGDAVGDRLSWHCFCDGQDTITRIAQADGVRFSWFSDTFLEQETDAAVADALAGLGRVG